MSRRFSLVTASALLAACAGTSPAPGTQPPPEPAPEVAAVELPERAFPRDSLYDLLVAEFALRRRDYDTALATYMTQSETLRDAGVSAHATRLGQYLQREEESLAAAHLWVELEPDNLEARGTLARLLVRSGRNAEALPHLAVIARAGHDANFPIVLNAFEELSAGERAALLAGIDELSAQFDEDTGILLTQALLLSEQEQYDRALQSLDRLFALEPEDEQALLLEARILAAQGAQDPYARVERALRDNPEDRLLRLRYARMLTSTDMRAAREQFEILSAQSPGDGDLLFSLALVNRELGDSLTASAYLRQMLELGQRVDEAHYYLGRIEEERNNFEEALDHYRAVQPGAEYLAASSRAGELLIDAGERERSREWFNAQRRANPRESDRLYGLEAELLARAGAADEAMALLDEALALSPGSPSLLYSRAMLFEQRGDLAAMERDLRTIIDSDPDNATALNALGYTLANRTARHDEALDLVSRALALEPDEPAILDSMGWVLYRQGRTEEAIDYLRRAYAEFPDPEVGAHLGEVLWVSGDTPGALEIWHEAAQQDPEHPVLRETLQRLGVGTPESIRVPAGGGDDPS